MTYLVLTILLNTAVFLLFKIFSKYNINSLQAIVVNYFTCVVTGCVFLGDMPFNTGNISQSWFYWALLMGAMFIFLFNFIAFSIDKSGLTASAVANKISLVIPAFFSCLLYNEKMGAGKLLGILLAFPAVYLTTRTDDKEETKRILLPVGLFIASGLLDTFVKYVEHTFLPQESTQSIYLIHVFATAAIIGLVILILRAFRGKEQFHWKNMLAGVILGIPNYFSMYYFVRLLNDDFLQSSADIPVNNISIVLLSALIATILFKERMTKLRIVGLVLSAISILLIICADING